MLQIVVEGSVSEPEPVNAALDEEIFVCFRDAPSTGFIWERVTELPTHLLEIKCDWVSDNAGIGGKGEHCFRYTCQVPLIVQLRFQLRRPWERTKPLKEAVVQLSWR